MLFEYLWICALKSTDALPTNMTTGLVFTLKDQLKTQTASGVFIGILILFQNKEYKPQKKKKENLSPW